MSLKQKTKKLFHGRYPYKITCRVVGINHLRNYIQTHIKQVAIPNFELYIAFINSRRFTNQQIDAQHLAKFCNICVDVINNYDLRIRIEHNIIDFYIQDKNIFKTVSAKLAPYITVITEPENDGELEKLLENKKYSLCDAYPHGKYRYKIIFKQMSVTAKLNLIKWAEKYQHRQIHIPYSVNEFLNCRIKYYANPYFYVEDEKTLMLVSIAAGNYVQRTEEYVLRSSINTLSKQEQLCPV